MLNDSFNNFEKKYIQGIEKFNMSYEEAKIYFKVIKYGKEGCMARELNEEIPDIERTTIYSILRRLIDYGCIFEIERQAGSKVKKFYALNPKKYFDTIISMKETELAQLNEIKKKISNDLEDFYKNGLEFSLNQIENEMKKYLEPLIANGWKILHQNIKKYIELFGFKLYDYRLKIPLSESEKYDKAGFLLFIFDYDIENDDLSLNYYFKQLKRILIRIHETPEELIEVIENKTTVFGKEFPSFLIKFIDRKNKKCLLESRTIIFPNKNKIFFVWSEERVEEIIKVIFQIENIN
ncbi:MAG: hypothetical protein JXA99_16985 [Candidatus Lokiarchaeota archaeon]|nr:hypothetical protein [Candidatus Lokiarchaeota archaeon]